VRTRRPGEADPAQERAWNTLFREETSRDVDKWLRKLGVPRRDRCDVAQAVFVQAIMSFATYDPARGRPERWLNRIAVHVASHYFDKALHRREVLAAPTRLNVIVGDDTDVLDRILSEERRLYLLELITRLPVHHARLLIGHDLQGRPMPELAEMQRIPLSTAYKRYARALAAAQALARDLQEAERLDGETVRVGRPGR
jgi:RNA polymerase sigma-70 factor, ECF subfamily